MIIQTDLILENMQCKGAPWFSRTQPPEQKVTVRQSDGAFHLPSFPASLKSFEHLLLCPTLIHNMEIQEASGRESYE